MQKKKKVEAVVEKLDKRVMQRELILLAGKKDMKFLQQRKQKGDATMIIDYKFRSVFPIVIL